MSRIRLYMAGRYAGGSLVELDADKARYLGRVLRLHIGDTIALFDGEGSEYEAEIVALGKSTARLKVGRSVDTHTESGLRIHLVQGISRGQRMDFVVQKATELGVKPITPVLTEYGAVNIDA